MHSDDTPRTGAGLGAGNAGDPAHTTEPDTGSEPSGTRPPADAASPRQPGKPGDEASKNPGAAMAPADRKTEPGGSEPGGTTPPADVGALGRAGGSGGVPGGEDAGWGGDGERLRRWRLLLGGDKADGTGVALTGDDARMDGALEKLYGAAERGEGRSRPGRRSAGLGDSAPSVARWLGDIRGYFPSSVVRVMQKDAIERLDLARLLLEPEMLEAVEPDVHLVGTLLSLNRVLPDRARESARAVVRTVVRDLERRLAQRTRSAVGGALDRSARVARPRRLADVDWDRTVRANLRHYLPDRGALVPERLVGYGRRRRAVQRDVVLAVDQSGSMAASVVFASVFGAVLASMGSLRTSLVVFDTAVADLTGHLHDPVDVLFGARLGGGTDIDRAVAYCQGLVTRPRDTILVLISDLYEGGDRDGLLRRVAALTAAGVRVVVLLALSDEGAPAYDHDNAAALAALGVPAFACTPDAFPDLMAAAIEGRDLAEWAERAT